MPWLAWGQANILPLAPGNTWTLTAGPYTSTLSVKSYKTVNGVARATIAFNNPWAPFSFLVRATAAGILLEGLQYETATNGYPDPVMMFGTGTAGQTWTSPYLTATLVSTNNTVQTPLGTYSNVLRYDLAFGSSIQTWYLAPEVGFVQFGAGTGLVLSDLNLNVAPPLSAAAPTPCPVVGISANPHANGNFSTAGKESALKAAIAAGSNFLGIETSWAQLEPSPGSYDLTSISTQLAWTTKYNLNAVLTLKTIDTMSRTIPKDLQGLSWNDARMITRWQNLLKVVLPTLTPRVKWINFGNEVDAYLATYPTELTPYSAFVAAGQSTSAMLIPGVSTGVVFGFDSWRLNDTVFRALSPQLDQISFTYYDANSTVPGYIQRDPSDVHFDMADMVTAANGKPLLITEIGYSSSTAIKSSPALQQTFYAEAFTAIANAGGKLTGASFSFMSDFPSATITALSAAYGPTGSPWVSWVGNLGLFDSQGVVKPAWGTFQTRAIQVRNNAGCQAMYQ